MGLLLLSIFSNFSFKHIKHFFYSDSGLYDLYFPIFFLEIFGVSFLLFSCQYSMESSVSFFSFQCWMIFCGLHIVVWIGFGRFLFMFWVRNPFWWKWVKQYCGYCLTNIHRSWGIFLFWYSYTLFYSLSVFFKYFLLWVLIAFKFGMHEYLICKSKV